jgi:hypothetical protein
MNNELTTSMPTALAGQAANRVASSRVFDDYRSRKAANTLRRHDADLALFARLLEEAGVIVGELSTQTRDAGCADNGPMGRASAAKEPETHRVPEVQFVPNANPNSTIIRRTVYLSTHGEPEIPTEGRDVTVDIPLKSGRTTANVPMDLPTGDVDSRRCLRKAGTGIEFLNQGIWSLSTSSPHDEQG